MKSFRDLLLEDIKYPLYKADIESGMIVKFSNLTTGEVISGSKKHVGHKGTFVAHTSPIWRDLTKNELFDPSLKESNLDESKTISGVFVVDGDSKEQPAKVTLDFSTLNSQKNGMLKITAGGKTYELHIDGDLTKLL